MRSTDYSGFCLACDHVRAIWTPIDWTHGGGSTHATHQPSQLPSYSISNGYSEASVSPATNQDASPERLGNLAGLDVACELDNLPLCVLAWYSIMSGERRTAAHPKPASELQMPPGICVRAPEPRSIPCLTSDRCLGCRVLLLAPATRLLVTRHTRCCPPGFSRFVRPNPSGFS